jgi:hypothetical protein
MMKKKLIPSLLVIMICAGLIFIVKGVQEKAAAVPQQAAQTAQSEQVTGSASASGNTVSGAAAASGANAGGQQETGSSGKAAATSSGSAAPASSATSSGTENKKTVSFSVYDAVSGKSLAAMTVEISDGETAADVTMKALDGDYRASGSGESIYFSKIMGIAEKSAGPLSGWCFYVNGQKPGISSGSYKVTDGDSVEWKFLKDGANN